MVKLHLINEPHANLCTEHKFVINLKRYRICVLNFDLITMKDGCKKINK